jgi:predicted RND superfamily exporter protein
MVVQMVQQKNDVEHQHLSDVELHASSLMERLIFNNRPWIITFCILLTVILGTNAAKLHVDTSFTAMLPEHQPYIVNYEANRGAMRALGDSIRIVVEHKNGDIYNPAYLDVLRQINDRVFLLPGVDRSYMQSLWTPAVGWMQITEQGITNGPVMPDHYDGSPANINQLRANISKADIIGSIVANDQRSSEILVPLLDRNPATSLPFNFGAFWREIQTKILSLQSASITIHIVGFAAIMGNLIEALYDMVGFFLATAALIAILIFATTRCIRSTIAIFSCSCIAVIWLLGIIHVLGDALDPYSILIPFLVFAIGVSHGAQKMNGIRQDIARGASSYVAARLTFRRLFGAGLTALIADSIGFMVLVVIDVPAIQTLAIVASVGVLILVFTNLVLLPVILSYTGVNGKKTSRHTTVQNVAQRLFQALEQLCERRNASYVLMGALLLLIMAEGLARNIQIGDVSPGAPELRANSRYNQDNSYVNSHYSLSSDEFAVIVSAGASAQGLVDFSTMLKMDHLEQTLRTLPNVETVVSAADWVRSCTAASFDGNLKWWTINRDSSILGEALECVYTYHPELMNDGFSVAPLIVYLRNHRAATIAAVADAVGHFADHNNSSDVQFLLAAGNAGMDAATNIVVQRAYRLIPYLVYGAVIALCFTFFRTWRAVIVAVLPLIFTSVLCQALMVAMGIGVKIATLPVAALGVGVGVDYALYLLSVQLSFQRKGAPLRFAYREALRFTGRTVAFVGFSLAVSVSLWAFSPIRFQADMGLLLAFMFIGNMLSTLILVPVLSSFFLQTVSLTHPRPDRGFHDAGVENLRQKYRLRRTGRVI